MYYKNVEILNFIQFFSHIFKKYSKYSNILNHKRRLSSTTNTLRYVSSYEGLKINHHFNIFYATSIIASTEIGQSELCLHFILLIYYRESLSFITLSFLLIQECFELKMYLHLEHFAQLIDRD